MITSCCPGWVKYIEMNYPELLPHLSTCKSPHQMFGALIKTYFAKKEAERLGGYQNIDCSPLKQSALGGSFLNNKYGGQSENKLKKIAQEEKNPIPLDFFYYPQYDDVHVRHALEDYKLYRYGKK